MIDLSRIDDIKFSGIDNTDYPDYSESIEKAGSQMSTWTFDADNTITQGLYSIADAIEKLAKAIEND